MNYYEFSTDIEFLDIPVRLSYTSENQEAGKDEVLKGEMTKDEITFLDIINKVLALFGGSGFGQDLDFQGLGVSQVFINFNLNKKTVNFNSTVKAEVLNFDFKFNFWEIEENEGFVFELVFDEKLKLPGGLPVIRDELKNNVYIHFDKILIATKEDKKNDIKEGFQFLGKRKIFGSEEEIDLYLFGPNPNTPQSYDTERSTAALANKNTKWYDIDKSLGPFTLRKIGFQYDELAWALVNADLKLGPLTFSVEGLKIGSPIKFPPKANDIEFGVNGIGLSMDNGPIRLTGSFLKASDIDKENYYSGLAILSLSEFTIDAFGGYGKLPNGSKSVFVFASVNFPIGGPPFFFVTGFSLGFGFNMGIQLPDIREVASYPLLDTSLFQDANNPTDALAKLNKFIYPEAGGLWFAVGIKFSTFEVIDSHAILVVDIGKVQIAILGLSILKLPKVGHPFVFVKLGLAIIYKIQEGIFMAFASIAEDSYVIDPSCKVFGDFAFYAWFKGAHKGDFVFSIGGYHPRFKKPAHYPELRRVGYAWRVSSAIRVRGETYFSLTPSAVMAGFRFEAVFDAEIAKAWFVAIANFLIQWKPFYYDIDIQIAIGVKIGFLKFELGVALWIYGPPIGGKAVVDVGIAEFTIRFGASHNPKAPLLDWAQFQENYLPKPELSTGTRSVENRQEDICRINISSGLLKKAKKDGAEKWLVRADEFMMNTESFFPIKMLNLQFFGELNESQNGQITKAIPHQQNTKFGIRPMGMSSLYHSKHSVHIVCIDDDNYTFNWKASPKTNRVPAALWATTPVHPERPEAKSIPAVVGMRNIVVLPRKQDIDKVEATLIKNFDYTFKTKVPILQESTAHIYSKLVDMEAAERSSLISQSIAETQAQRTSFLNLVNQVLDLKEGEQLKDELHHLDVEEHFQSIPRIGYIENLGTTSVQAIKELPLDIFTPSVFDTKPYFKLRKALRQYSKNYLADFTLIQEGLFKPEQLEMRIHQGSSFLFDVRKADELQKNLTFQGGRHLQILAFDAYGHPIRIERTTSANITPSLLAETHELFIQGLPNYNPSSYACGWTADHFLPFVNRVALVGPQFVLRPQAPVKGGEKGWVDMRKVLIKNTVLGENGQLFKGYTDTQFLSQQTKEVVVLLRKTKNGGSEPERRLKVSIPYRAKTALSDIVYTKNFLTASHVQSVGKFIRLRYTIPSHISPSKLLAIRAYMPEAYQQYWEINGVIGLCSSGSLPNNAWLSTNLVEETYQVAKQEGIAPKLIIT